MKILTIIGARPQIIKAAALNRAVRNKFNGQLREVIVHTGQHYDENMSEIFFQELEIPVPDYNLKVGSGSHGLQTAKMLEGIEEILLKEKPSCMVLYGDTNSTLAGAMAAAKLHVPVVHIEAGLRSFNKSMPEEINRIACDHVSTLLFSPTRSGVRNLIKEGFLEEHNERPPSIDNPRIFHCGDVMYDNSLYFSKISDQKSNILKELGISQGEYILSTIHRNNNTDEPDRLSSIFRSLIEIACTFEKTILLPLHPRTSGLLKKNITEDLYERIINNNRIRIIEPVGFLEMIILEKNAEMVITDSGGVQKEAYFFKKPCIILRSETEWVEIVENGCAMVTDVDTEKIINAYKYLSKGTREFPEIFGDGKSAEFICENIVKNIKG